MTSESPQVPLQRIVVRHAARVLVIDERSRVLLFLFRYRPADGVLREVWIPPGGGLDPDETHLQAAERELWEETGLRADLSVCVWTRSHTNPWMDYIVEQHERFFVARVEAPEVVLTNQLAEERQLMPEYRWWTLEEIAASREWFAPRALAAALAPIVAGEYPAEPFDVGV